MNKYKIITTYKRKYFHVIIFFDNLLIYVAVPNVVAGCIYLEVCSTTEWKS